MQYHDNTANYGIRLHYDNLIFLQLMFFEVLYEIKGDGTGTPNAHAYTPTPNTPSLRLTILYHKCTRAHIIQTHRADFSCHDTGLRQNLGLTLVLQHPLKNLT